MMMKLRKPLALVMLSLALMGTPASADRMRDAIVQQLQAQGYRKITISQTLLGRTRIVATTKTLRREIIVNPRTGEILRDFQEGDDGTGPLIAPVDRSAFAKEAPAASADGEDGEDGDDGAEAGDDGDSGDDGGDSDGDDGGDGDGDGDGDDDGEGDGDGDGEGEGDGDGDGDGDGEGDSD